MSKRSGNKNKTKQGPKEAVKRTKQKNVTRKG
jgi:hypothetical protein